MASQKSKTGSSQCQATHPETNELVCDRSVWNRDEKRCIFHSSEKPTDTFKEHFLAELKRVNEMDSIEFFDGRCFIFPKNIKLEELSFEKRVIFDCAQFEHNMSFRATQFGDKAYFGSAQFGNKSDFEEAKFGDGAFFRETKFGDKAAFGKVLFGDKADFVDVKFGDRQNFSYTRFSGETIFENINYEDARVDRIVNFTNVIFEKPNQVRIQNVDLRSFALVRSNVQDVDFLDCKWPTIGKRLVIFDEIYYSNHDDNKSQPFLQRATLGEIEQLYRRLQLNFENNKRYAEAGNFYIGAMEMRRTQIAEESNKAWRRLRQSVLSLEAWYRNVSLYGERWARTLIWMVLVIFLFPTLYLSAGFEYQKTSLTNGPRNRINYDLGGTMNLSQISKDYLKALNISFLTFTFQRSTPFRHTDVSRVIAVVEAAISATLIALFLLAMRRRFRR